MNYSVKEDSAFSQSADWSEGEKYGFYFVWRDTRLVIRSKMTFSLAPVIGSFKHINQIYWVNSRFFMYENNHTHTHTNNAIHANLALLWNVFIRCLFSIFKLWIRLSSYSLFLFIVQVQTNSNVRFIKFIYVMVITNVDDYGIILLWQSGVWR